MKILASSFVLLLTACGGNPAGPGSEKNSGQTMEQQAVESLLSKDQILETLTRHGLNPQTVPAPEVSKKMAAALSAMPEGPVDRFLLGIDNEGLMAFEFSSVEMAKLMESGHTGEGFRHHNWYFGGIVSATVFNKTRNALREG